MMVAARRIWTLEARQRIWTLGPRLTSGTMAPGVIDKQNSERLYLSMDFSKWASGKDRNVATPQVISDPIISWFPDEDLVVSSVGVVGWTVAFFVSGGLTGKTYVVSVLVESNSGEVFQGSGILKVSGR